MNSQRSQRTKTRLARERAETVTCPSCAAAPGEHCVAIGGRTCFPHAGRMRLAKRAAWKEQRP
jgi:hypothetical protein